LVLRACRERVLEVSRQCVRVGTSSLTVLRCFLHAEMRVATLVPGSRELAHVHLTTSPPPKSGPFSGSTSPKVSLRRALRLRPATGRCNDLWPAEEQDEKFDEERLWCRPEDDSKTNTDSEAVAALEFMLAFI